MSKTFPTDFPTATEVTPSDMVMIDDGTTAKAASVSTIVQGAGATVIEQPAGSPLSLANNASYVMEHATVTNERIMVDVWYDTTLAGQTLVAFDCDLADASQFVQQDDTKTEFASGVVRLFNPFTPAVFDATRKSTAFTILESGRRLDGTTGLQSGVAVNTGHSSGKWYFELEVIVGFSGVTGMIVGMWDPSYTTTFYPKSAYGSIYIGTTGSISAFQNGDYSGDSVVVTAGSIIGFAVDVDARTVKVYQNNVLKGTFTMAGSRSGDDIITVCNDSAANPLDVRGNFGQVAFANTVPSGYTAGW